MSLDSLTYIGIDVKLSPKALYENRLFMHVRIELHGGERARPVQPTLSDMCYERSEVSVADSYSIRSATM